MIEEVLVEVKEIVASKPTPIVIETQTEPVELSKEQVDSLLVSDSFSAFFDRSSKIMERALHEEYDILTDYTMGCNEAEQDLDVGKSVKLAFTFSHDKWTKNRTVTSVDWYRLI